MRTRRLVPPVAALLFPAFLASQQAMAQATAPTASPEPSAAVPNKTEARRVIYQKGSDALRAKNWAHAERLFKQLWIERPTYDVALGLGQAELLQKKYRAAAEHLEFGIRNFPPREKPEALDLPKQALLAAKKHVATLQVVVNRPNAEVFIDGSAVATSPLESDLFVEAGSHTVEARLKDFPDARQTFDAKANEGQSLELTFAEPQVAPPPPRLATPPLPVVGSGLDAKPKQQAKAPLEARTVALWAGVGVTAVALGLGVGFALKGSSASDDAEKTQSQLAPGACQLPSNASLCASLTHSLDQRNAAHRAATLSFAVAGVAAVATTALFFIWPKATAQLHVVPVATRNTAGLLINGNF